MEKEIILFPHNEEAYKKLVYCLKGNQMVSINHATGTGKSFIVLKYLYENRNKRILYLSPTYAINDQLIEDHMFDLGIDISEFVKFDTIIYRNFSELDMEEIASQYDIVILDEYHRCGALKWGRAVNKLLKILKEKYPNVKVIGTTATEIRYLDNEKNMNNILFDGVCASTLTLADAILKGILPAPTYISLFGDLFNTLNKLESAVNEKFVFNVNKRKFLDEIKFIQQLFTDIISNDEYINKYLEDVDGKHLVFSSKIDDIKEDIDFIKEKFFDGKDVNIFIVHSKNSKLKNKKILCEFRHAKNGINILFSVNMLNEGVHVKKVKSIFMLRGTKSPIIYFQQLGRLLSFSSKDDDLVVFDLADNLRNHKVIYKLYQEVVERAKNLIIEEPDKKDFYESIISKFKILDKASDIYNKIDEISNQLKYDNLIDLRLETAISILEGSIETNEVERLQARIFIFKYVDYITLSMFSRIKKLNILKPKIFDLSEEEFSVFLDNNKNIYGKKKNYIVYLGKELLSFLKINNRVPSMFSSEQMESKLAIEMNNYFGKFDEETIEILMEAIKSDTNLSLVEHFNYNGTVPFYDEEKTYQFLDFAMLYGINISINFINLLKKFDNEKSRSYLEKIDMINNQGNEEIKFETSKQDLLFKENSNIYYKKEFSKVMVKYSILVSENGIDAVLKKLYLDICDFVDHMKKLPSYSNSRSYDQNLVSYLDVERELYCGMIIFYSSLKEKSYIDKIYDRVEKVKENTQNSKTKMLFDKFVAFVVGDLSNMTYEELKSFYNYNISKEYKALTGLLDEYGQKNLDGYFKMYQVRCSELVLKYIDFLLVYKRYPIMESGDNEEINLYCFFNNKNSLLSKEDKKKIREVANSIGTKKLVYNTHVALMQFEEEIKRNKGKIKNLIQDK